MTFVRTREVHKVHRAARAAAQKHSQGLVRALRAFRSPVGFCELHDYRKLRDLPGSLLQKKPTVLFPYGRQHAIIAASSNQRKCA